MTIRYKTNLTIEEQLDWWDSAGNTDEVTLAEWLRQHLIDIEEQQANDIAELQETAYREGYVDGERHALASQGIS